MKTIIISGSRNPNGQTATAANAFLNGFVEGGGEGEIVYLPTLGIERCRQCEDSGWGICITEGKCIIPDDFAALIDKVWAADVVAFANPVYFADISESLRAFLDRFRRIQMFKASSQTAEGRPAVLICVAGGGGGGAPECMDSMLKVVSRIGFEVVAQLPVRRQNLAEKSAEIFAIGKKIAAEG